MVLVDIFVIPRLWLSNFDSLYQFYTADTPGPAVIFGEAGRSKGSIALPPIAAPSFLHISDQFKVLDQGFVMLRCHIVITIGR